MILLTPQIEFLGNCQCIGGEQHRYWFFPNLIFFKFRLTLSAANHISMQANRLKEEPQSPISEFSKVRESRNTELRSTF